MLIFWAVLGGFLLDALFGDPAWLPHPVVLMGRCISRLEKFLRARLPGTPQGELLGGAVTAFCLPVGTLLLTLPISSRTGRLGVIDAMFTATSATCVTGLVVRDTWSQFSLFGQVVILMLIQVGGLGLVTLTSFFALAAPLKPPPMQSTSG